MAQLELTVRQEELRLELLLLQVAQLKAEKERLALTEEVRLLERNLNPVLMVPPEHLEPPEQLELGPGQLMVLPPGPAMPEEPMPDPMQEIAQRIGLSLLPSSSPDSES